jgi:aromatic ring-opening dioxygenase catalytic subunit (LigB family)
MTTQLTTDNGAKKPTELAKEIINAAIEDKMVVISGTAFQKLETVVRYLNRDKLQARSEAWFVSNFDRLCTETMETLVNAREKAIVDYLAKKEADEKAESFRLLVAKGITVPDAYAKVYGASAGK